MPTVICSRPPVRRALPEKASDKLSQVTTPSETPHGVPFLPPQSGSASPKAIAMALDDPHLVADEMPYLPPAPPPKPAVNVPQVFDAKTLVNATKRKVENPAYGHMPTGTPEGRAAADAARARMRHKRRRNKILGWVMTIAFLALIGGVGYALYTMYQHDQDKEHAEQAAKAAEAEAADSRSAGAATPLGEQAEIIEGLDELNSGAVASGRAATQAIDQAQQVANDANGQPEGSSSTSIVDVLPPEIAAVATELRPLDGMTRYIVVFDDAALAAPLATPGWVARLQGMPQSRAQSDGQTLLPAVGPGEIAIAFTSDGDQVTRLIVVSTDPAIHVDL